MSIVPKETVEVIAQSVGIPSLGPDVAAALAPDVEYRLREIMQESIKCMRHAKRTVLTADDVESALSLRNVEPVYGFASGDPLRFKRAVGHKDLFYLDDREVDFKEIIEAPLPKAPLDTAVVAHWLAIEGVQPAIPENPPIDAIVPPAENKRSEHGKDDGHPVDVKLPVKHVLSRELQMYFDKIAELTMSRSDTSLFKEALVSLAKDSGLHPLVPYFSYFIADEVTRSLGDLPVLFALMRVVRSLLHNPHIHIEPYLHQLMPSMITCIVAKRLGHRLSDNHWELRDFSANLVALIRLLLLPNLVTYMQLLEPELQLEKQKNEMKRKEAWRVYDKRKSSTDLSASQPPLKMAKDASVNSMAGNMQGAMDGFSTQLGNPGMMQASSSGQIVESIASAGIRRDQGSDLAQRVSTVLRQAWKEDQDAGHLLGSLYEVFGEGIFSFVQPPEISLFV
nr:unnamed protein product [Digitaria exilis]